MGILEYWNDGIYPPEFGHVKWIFSYQKVFLSYFPNIPRYHHSIIPRLTNGKLACEKAETRPAKKTDIANKQYNFRDV